MPTKCKKCGESALVKEPYGFYCAECWVKDHDMRAKGKHIHKHYHGTRVHTAKLTADDVRLIDALLSEGMKQSVIAEKFAVSRNAINDIAKGHTWKQVLGVGL